MPPPFRGAVGVVVALMLSGANLAAAPVYDVRGDGVDAPLSPRPGDAVNGRRLVADRQRGACLLCHAAPIPEERFQGDIGPDLKGVASRLDVARLRLRVADARFLNPASVMPSYFPVNFNDKRPNRPAPDKIGRPLLNADEVEDVVAFLLTLKD